MGYAGRRCRWEEVKDVTTSGAAGSATTTAPTEVKVSGSDRDSDRSRLRTQSEILKQAAEKKSAEIILEVSKRRHARARTAYSFRLM